MARTGEKGPVLPLGNLGWNGRDWEPIFVFEGGTAVTVRAWGDPAVLLTGRDITPDIRSLGDDGVVGMLRSLGDAGAGPSNTTGKTVLQLLTEILLASGGGVNEHYETPAAVAVPLAGGVSGTQTWTQPIEFVQFLVRNNDVEIETQDLSAAWSGNYIPLTKNSIAVIPLAGVAWRVRNLGGAVYPALQQATVYATGYYN